MNYQICDVRNEASLDDVKLTLYLLDDSPDIPIHRRPVIIICPGGGYGFTSDREAEIVALQFTAMGYHAAVLRYSVSPAVYPTALLELAGSVALLRQHADEYHIDKDKIVVSGFSAGGHLAGCLGMFWHQEWLSKKLSASPEDIRPNAMILCYPVITSGEFAHDDSFRKLLAEQYDNKKTELSLEYCVSEYTPRTFVWHTFQDALVPIQNTLFLVNELVKYHIPVEYHLFEKGGHALSIANRLTGACDASVAEWIPLAHLWIERWIMDSPTD